MRVTQGTATFPDPTDKPRRLVLESKDVALTQGLWGSPWWPENLTLKLIMIFNIIKSVFNEERFMRRKRVLWIGGEEIEIEAERAKILIERLVLLTHGNAAARGSYEALNQLLSSGQLTACERHLLNSVGDLQDLPR